MLVVTSVGVWLKKKHKGQVKTQAKTKPKKKKSKGKKEKKLMFSASSVLWFYAVISLCPNREISE